MCGSVWWRGRAASLHGCCSLVPSPACLPLLTVGSLLLLLLLTISAPADRTAPQFMLSERLASVEVVSTRLFVFQPVQGEQTSGADGVVGLVQRWLLSLK